MLVAGNYSARLVLLDKFGGSAGGWPGGLVQSRLAKMRQHRLPWRRQHRLWACFVPDHSQHDRRRHEPNSQVNPAQLRPDLAVFGFRFFVMQVFQNVSFPLPAVRLLHPGGIATIPNISVCPACRLVGCTLATDHTAIV